MQIHPSLPSTRTWWTKPGSQVAPSAIVVGVAVEVAALVGMCAHAPMVQQLDLGAQKVEQA